MSYNNHPHTGLALQVGRPPWLMFLFLAAVFFLIYHDLSYSKNGIDDFTSSMDDIIADVAEGTLVRRIALLSLGLFAIVSLIRHRANGRLRIRVLGFCMFQGQRRLG